MTPKEMEDACNVALAAYVKGDFRTSTNLDGSPPPPFTGIRRRRPALVSMEEGNFADDPVVTGAPVDVAPETTADPPGLLLDLCGLEDFVVLNQGAAIEIAYLWVSSYPISAPAPSPSDPKAPPLDILKVDFSDDAGGRPNTTRILAPAGAGEPEKVAQECKFMLDGRIGEDFTSGQVSHRVVVCKFEELVTVRDALLAGTI